jgi:hypothetical protein
VSDANERAKFEQWLVDVHGLSSEWQENRNCYEQFPAHLAYRAWLASGSRIRELEAQLERCRAANVYDANAHKRVAELKAVLRKLIDSYMSGEGWFANVVAEAQALLTDTETLTQREVKP